MSDELRQVITGIPNHDLQRAIAQVFTLRPDGAHEMRRRCPFCLRVVEAKDFISSFREQLGGGFIAVQLCRTCRDSGI